MKEDIYENFSQRKYHLKLIQYYALYDPNGDQGVIQGLRYYPRDVNTVIPNNPALKSTINYYKPYTNPRVVLPKPRYKKKISNKTKVENLSNNDNINTLNQKNFMNNDLNGNDNIEKTNNENYNVYRTFRRTYNNENEEQKV